MKYVFFSLCFLRERMGSQYEMFSIFYAKFFLHLAYYMKCLHNFEKYITTISLFYFCSVQMEDMKGRMGNYLFWKPKRTLM